MACLSAMSFANAEMPKGLDAPVKFPIVTPTLTPKAFESYPNPTAKNGSQVSAPICVIGHDSLSIAWLNQKKDQLIEAAAMCFVVNVESAADFSQLQSIVPKLRMAPVSANWLNTLLKIQHYPVLITSEWIAQ